MIVPTGPYKFKYTYSCRVRGYNEYELTNHLGNVMVTVSDLKLGIDTDNDNIADAFVAHVLSYTDYYPFGMPMPGRQYNGGGYKYGFNGMEKDDEVKGNGNSLDFGARIYDPRVGRWLSVDPQAARGPWISPYAFAFNNPTRFVDPDGEFPWDAVLDVVQGVIDVVGMIPAVGNIADLANAGIYALRGDEIGVAMSLAAAIPGAGLVAGAANIGRKVYKGAKAIFKAKKAKVALEVAEEATEYSGKMLDEVPIVRSTDPAPGQFATRPKLRKGTKEDIIRNAETGIDANGKRRFIDPETGEFIPGNKVTKHPDTGEEIYGTFDYGHKQGDEWVDYKSNPDNWSKTRKEVIEDQNDPNKYQIEARSRNRSKGGKVGAERKKQKKEDNLSI